MEGAVIPKTIKEICLVMIALSKGSGVLQLGKRNVMDQ